VDGEALSAQPTVDRAAKPQTWTRRPKRQPQPSAQGPVGPRLWRVSWVAVLGLAMMVAADYKFRVRPPSQSLSGRPDLSVLLEMVVYGAVAGFLLLQIGGPLRLRPPTSLLLIMWTFSLTLFVTSFYAVYPGLAVVRGLQLLITCGFCQAVTKRATRRQLHWFAHAYTALAAGSVIFGALVHFPRFKLQQHRFNWLYVHPVIAGTYLGLAVVLLVVYLATNGRDRPVRWPRPVYVALLSVNVVGLLATRTRGALLGCALGAMVAIVASRRARTKLDSLVVIGASAAFVFLVFGDVVQRFLERGQSREAFSTLTARTELWEQALELVRQRPLTGYGLTASRGLFFETTGLGGGHNAFINVLTDAGLIGLLTFVAVLVVLVRSISSLKGRPSTIGDRTLLWAALAFLVLNSMTTEGLGTPANVSNIWLFALAGWVGALQRAPSGPSRLGDAWSAARGAAHPGVGFAPPQALPAGRQDDWRTQPVAHGAKGGRSLRPASEGGRSPSPAPETAQPPSRAAGELGIAHHRFPPRTGNLWIPTNSAESARAGLSLYSACFTRARLAHRGAWSLIGLTGSTRVLGPRSSWSPPMEAGHWEHLLGVWMDEVGSFDSFAVHERRQPSRQGLGFLLLSRDEPVAFVKARPADGRAVMEVERAALEQCERHRGGLVVPRVMAAGRDAGWEWLAMTVVHSTPHEPVFGVNVGSVTEEVRERLRGWKDRPTGVPLHWEPMHGDLTPWNLRRLGRRRLALFDWEDAGWGPPFADDVYFLATRAALGVGMGTSPGNREAVTFWLDVTARRDHTGAPAAFVKRLHGALRAMAG